MSELQSFTFVTDSEIMLNHSRCIDPVLVHMLPGEVFISFSLLNYGCRFGVTNYRLIIVFDSLNHRTPIDVSCDLDNEQNNTQKNNSNTSKIISIPIGLIYHVEHYGMLCLNIITKIATRFSITFPNIELCEETQRTIRIMREKKPFSIDFRHALSNDMPNHFILNGQSPDDDWLSEFDVIQSEFIRLKFTQDQWRITQVNKKYEICMSYPRYQIVPNSFSDEQIKNMARFRGKKRFLSVCYKTSREVGTILLRSGQPMTGVSNYRNVDDEKFIQTIIDLSRRDGIRNCERRGSINSINSIYLFKILDARSYTVSQTNRLNGGGMESEANYSRCQLEFLNIPNIHAVKTSFDALSNCLANDSNNFYELLDRSGWLQLIRQLLESAYNICKIMLYDQKSVLVHCTDGWDRTPQLVALAQLLMDPYYRRISGFITLIRKEWIFFGHKFNERNGLWPKDCKEFSPIFIQWIDCVFQLLRQFPEQFEFNELFLIKLALHTTSGLFGTFNSSMSSTKNITSHNTNLSTCSLWNLLHHRDQRCFMNPLYSPTSPLANNPTMLIHPRTQLPHVRLWTALYKDGLNPHRDLDSNLFSAAPQTINTINHQPVKETNTFVLARQQMSQENKMINDDDDDNKDTEEKDEDDEDEDDEDDNEKIIDDEELRELEKTIEGFKKAALLSTNETKTQETQNPYFNIIRLTDSLRAWNDTTTFIPQVDYNELGFDGLIHQKDLVNIYSDMYRKNRKLLQKKIDYLCRKCRDFVRRLKRFSEKEVYEVATNNDAEVDDDDDDDLENIEFDVEDALPVVSEHVSRVRWIPDNVVTKCTSCEEQFGMFYRKHHCRNCGNIFCHKCSSKRCEIPRELLYYPNRVCDSCYDKLKSSNILEQTIYPHSESSTPESRFEYFKRIIGL